VVGLIF
jgi:hypothetical protein